MGGEGREEGGRGGGEEKRGEVGREVGGMGGNGELRGRESITDNRIHTILEYVNS